MAKDFKVTIECEIPQRAAVDFIKSCFRSAIRNEITPPETLQAQRELRDMVRKESNT